MTEQVRTGYRKHRKAAWGLALVVVAAIAAVTIPLASGAPSKTLKFVAGPTPSLLQSSSPATPTTVAVAVFTGGSNPVNSNPPPAPVLGWTGLGDLNTLFVVDGPNYSTGTKSWSWNVTPTSSAPSGVFKFTATLGDLTAAPSSAFRVAQFVCPAGGGPSCNGTSNFGTPGQGNLKIANTLGSSIALDFQPGGAAAPLGCNNDPNDQTDNNDPTHTWTRAYYLAANGDKVYFPAVALDFNSNSGDVLQITYGVRNSQWVITNAARGNNDVEFCVEAKHQDATKNDYPPSAEHPTGHGVPFAGKYGPATWDPSTGMFSGVLQTVSNPSKVKSGGNPAVCGRGSQDITTNGITETWRTWTMCVAFDWDWGPKPS
jgi:hypothetical protein